MSELHLAIVTPDGSVFSGPVSLVMAPGLEGNFTVLRGHAPMIAALQLGVARVVDAAGEKYYVVDRGVFEVHANDAVILCRWARAVDSKAQTDDVIKARRAELEAEDAKHHPAPKPAATAGH